MDKLLEKYQDIEERFRAGSSGSALSPIARRDLDYEAAQWLLEAELMLLKEDSDNASLAELLPMYERIYSLRNRKVGSELADTIRKRIFARRIKGDRSLNDTEVMLTLWPMVEANYLTIESRLRDFCLDRFDAWMRELLLYGRFRGISDREASLRLSHIRSRDLSTYLPRP